MRQSWPALVAVAAAFAPSPLAPAASAPSLRTPPHRACLAPRRPSKLRMLASEEAAPKTREEKEGCEWTTLVLALEAYKGAHGDLRVPTRYTVPEEEGFPESTRGLKLGQRVASIRATGRYVDDESRRSILDAMGFEWRLRRPSASQQAEIVAEPFDVLVTALEVYQSEINSDPVPSTFVVPNADPWPPSCRGLPLGARVEALRDPDHPYFEGPDLAEREATLVALGALKPSGEAGGRTERQSTAKRFEIVYAALEAFKAVYGHLNVQQTFVVPSSNDWPEDAWAMKLGSRVNAIRSHGTFLKRHPERRARLRDLGLDLNDAPPPPPEKPGSLLDAVLKGVKTTSERGEAVPVPAWAGISGEDFEEEPEEEDIERPRVAGLDADFLDESIMYPEELARRTKEGWRFDDFDGGFDFEDVVDALTEYLARFGDLDVPVDFSVPEDDGEDEEVGSEDVEDLDAALAAFLSAASPADTDDAALLGDAPLDAEPSEEELLALEGALPSAQPREPPWPEHCRGLLLGRAVDALRVGDAQVNDRQRQVLDDLGFAWGERRISGLSWNEFLGCLFSFSKIKGSLNVRWDFRVPPEDPWPLPFYGLPLGEWVNEVRAQKPVFEQHFAERKRFLDLMGFKWLPAVFEGEDVGGDAARDQRVPPCLRLDDEELFPIAKKKRVKKVKEPKKPLTRPTRGDVDVEYAKFTVKVLKELLKERGLPVSGRRKADHCELLSADDVERQAELASAPAVDDLDDDDEEDEEDEEDDDDLPDEEEEELDAVTALSEALGAGDEGEADKDDEA